MPKPTQHDKNYAQGLTHIGYMTLYLAPSPGKCWPRKVFSKHWGGYLYPSIRTTSRSGQTWVTARSSRAGATGTCRVCCCAVLPRCCSPCCDECKETAEEIYNQSYFWSSTLRGPSYWQSLLLFACAFWENVICYIHRDVICSGFSRDSLCRNPLRQKQSSGKSRNNHIPAVRKSIKNQGQKIELNRSQRSSMYKFGRTIKFHSRTRCLTSVKKFGCRRCFARKRLIFWWMRWSPFCSLSNVAHSQWR